MKTALSILGIACLATALVLSIALMLTRREAWWWGALALLAAAGMVAWAAWIWRSTPAPIPAPVEEWLVWDDVLDADQAEQVRQMLRADCVPADPVDRHQAQMAAALRQPGWPELPLILPSQRTYTRHRRSQR